ncbi:MAG: hypothetical protein WBM98_11855 [Maribacter sp.]|uniref:hypothetical protein n=1 Tax=Maribacter sp. TaxID=1897614 RepID=UPI003C70725D
MEVDRFEKHIKEQLQRREINPSEAAWEKLSGQLPKAKHRKSMKFLWYGMAASFIGMVLIASIYFGNDTEPINAGVEVVDAPKEVDIMLQKEVLPEQHSMDAQQVEAEAEVNVIKEKTKERRPILKSTDNSQFAVTQATDNGPLETKTIQTNTEQLIDSKIAELIVQVDFMEDNHLQVTDAELDSLLRKAENEILSQKIRAQGGKIDAMALLDEVETELDQSFRAQIFESLKAGFLKVRTAVADRNN